LWEIFASPFFIERFEFGDNFRKVLGTQVAVVFNAFLCLDVAKDMFELMFFKFNNNVCKHHNKTAITVVSESWVSRQFRKALRRLVVKSKVQNRIHHSWHRCA
jgi:hypothetical protein